MGSESSKPAPQYLPRDEALPSDEHLYLAQEERRARIVPRMTRVIGWAPASASTVTQQEANLASASHAPFELADVVAQHHTGALPSQREDAEREDAERDIVHALSYELLLMVLQRLPPSSLTACACVCRRWRDVLQSPLPWSGALETFVGIEPAWEENWRADHQRRTLERWVEAVKRKHGEPRPGSACLSHTYSEEQRRRREEYRLLCMYVTVMLSHIVDSTPDDGEALRLVLMFALRKGMHVLANSIHRRRPHLIRSLFALPLSSREAKLHWTLDVTDGRLLCYAYSMSFGGIPVSEPHGTYQALLLAAAEHGLPRVFSFLMRQRPAELVFPQEVSTALCEVVSDERSLMLFMEHEPPSSAMLCAACRIGSFSAAERMLSSVAPSAHALMFAFSKPRIMKLLLCNGADPHQSGRHIYLPGQLTTALSFYVWLENRSQDTDEARAECAALLIEHGLSKPAVRSVERSVRTFALKSRKLSAAVEKFWGAEA